MSRSLPLSSTVMPMKNTLLVLVTLLLSVSSFGQEQVSFGISGGMTLSSIKAMDFLPVEYNYEPGYAGELFARLLLNPHIFLECDLGILQRGYRFEDESTLSIGGTEYENSYMGANWKVSDSYTNTDLLIGYQTGNTLSISICGGAFLSYYLFSNIYDHNYAYIDPVDHELINDPAIPVGMSENKSETRKRNEYTSNWDLGITGCISVEYDLNSKTSLRLTGKYHHGLINTYDNESWDQAKIYNRSFVTTLGILLRK